MDPEYTVDQTELLFENLHSLPKNKFIHEAFVNLVYCM